MTTTNRPSPEPRAPTPPGFYRPTWAEIDLLAFSRNVDAIVKRLPAGSRLIAVLKANGYGHGAIELARRCTPDRVAMVAVALLEEALELRRAGIALPLLLLGSVGGVDEVALAASNDITLGVTSPEMLQIAGSFAREHDVAVAINLDSGMGRVGLRIGDLPEAIEIIRRSPRLKITAIYTHFANSGDPRDPYTDVQMATFRGMVSTLRNSGIHASLHEANSGATMRGIVVPGDLSRVCIALYGGEALEDGE